MRRRTMSKWILGALLVLTLALPASAGGGQEPIGDGYYTVAWEMPHAPTGTGANAPWPQTLYAWQATVGPDLDYLDGLMVGCGWFQIDVYKIDSERDRTKLAWLLDKGTLTWPEDRSIYHSSKVIEVTECETTTTDPTTTTTLGTTTTTEQESTTTTTAPESTTSTPGPSTTTSAPASSTTDPGTPVLPFTGAETSLMVLAGLSLLALGAITIYSVRSEGRS